MLLLSVVTQNLRFILGQESEFETKGPVEGNKLLLAGQWMRNYECSHESLKKKT